MTISLPASRERIESTWGGSWWLTNEIVHYVYDGNLVLQERHYSNLHLPDLAPQLVTYTRGKDLSGSMQGAGGIGGLLARSEISNLQSPHAYYHADGNGNVTALAMRTARSSPNTFTIHTAT